MAENKQTHKILPQEGTRLRVQKNGVQLKLEVTKHYTVDCKRDSHGRHLAEEAWIRRRQSLLLVSWRPCGTWSGLSTSFSLRQPSRCVVVKTKMIVHLKHNNIFNNKLHIVEYIVVF